MAENVKADYELLTVLHKLRKNHLPQPLGQNVMSQRVFLSFLTWIPGYHLMNHT